MNHAGETILSWCTVMETGDYEGIYTKYLFLFQYGMRAVLWAAWFGHSEALRILVNNGANIHASNKVSGTLAVSELCLA